MIYRKIDLQTGVFLEDVPMDFQPKIKDTQGNTIPDPQYIEGDVPQGFILPKWNGTEWVEGGTVQGETKEAEIARLKQEIAATDYKIIKCTEYNLMGEESPYDFTALHEERQTKRDRINQLESE